MTHNKPERVAAKHIASEYEDSDGYWIDLKQGWKWSGDPLGVVHGIHEETRARARRETVMVCDCDLCTKPPHLQPKFLPPTMSPRIVLDGGYMKPLQCL